MEKYKSDLSQTRAIIRYRQNIYQRYCNLVKVHSFPYKITLKSFYLVKAFTFCDALSTAGWLQLTSQKCPFWVLFWWVRAENKSFLWNKSFYWAETFHSCSHMICVCVGKKTMIVGWTFCLAPTLSENVLELTVAWDRSKGLWYAEQFSINSIVAAPNF